MKKNVKKLNKKLKAILCLCLALLFSFSAFLFAGCDKDIGDIGGGSGSGGGENQRTFFENYVSGIAAVYANSESGGHSGLSNENTKDLLRTIESALLANYGSGELFYKYKYSNNKYEYSNNTPFYDSIRMLVTAPNNNIQSITDVKLGSNYYWKWLINPSTIDSTMPRTTERYVDWTTRMSDKENSPFTNYNFNSFSDIFQIALYEIMLGKSENTILNIISKKVTDQFEIQINNESVLCSYYYEIQVKNSNTLHDLKDKPIYLDFSGVGKTSGRTYRSESIDLSGNKAKIQEVLKSLQQEYLSKSRYVGLTKQNADKLIDYILTEIIGKDLVLYDYNTYKNQQVNFRNYVETIAYLVYSQTYDGSNEDWVYSFPSGNSTKITYTFNQGQREKAQTPAKAEDPSSALLIGERGSFSAKPATYVKYFPGESFFGDPDATDQFAGKPYAEYQSIVIVPAISAETTKDGGIKLEAGFVFNFMSRNKNLRIIPKVRYCVYNEETGTQFFYEFDADEINFSGAESFVNAAGQTCYEDDFDFGVDISKLDPSLVKTQVDSTGYKETTYTVGFFKNKELLDSVVDETRLTDQADVQDFYKVVESKNGHGGTTVLNEKHINSSFFEIVFDIVKSESDPENTDYNFSLVLSNSLLYPGIY